MLAFVNSKVIRYFWSCNYSDSKATFPKIKKTELESLPIVMPSKDVQRTLSGMVNNIMSIKIENPKADTSALEAEIDQMVYTLYNLTPEEINLIENAK